MSMRITPAKIKEIADKVTALNSLGVEVKSIKMHGHEIFLSQDSGMHVIVGISNRNTPEGGATR